MALDAKKMREANDEMLLAMPELLRFSILSAQITRAKFDALRKEGFSESQALELCRTGNSIA